MPTTTLHYASGDVGNNGFDPAAAALGFNVADVSDADTLKSLPDGVKGVYFLNEAQGVTTDFVSQMNAIKGSSNLLAVYLADEPDPSKVSAADLKAESDWIHTNMPGVKTFVVADFQGEDSNPNYAAQGYTAANTGVDLWGIDVYPVVKGSSAPDYQEIDTAVHNAETQIGITADRIVPVYQAFGGGFSGGPWTTPSADQEKAIIAEYAKAVPNPVFDYAYSWVQQEGDTPLSQLPALQQVFKDNFSAGGTVDPTTPATTPSTPAGTGTGTGSTTSGNAADPATPAAPIGSTTGSDPASVPALVTGDTGHGHHAHGHDGNGGFHSAYGSAPSNDLGASALTGTSVGDSTGGYFHHHAADTLA